MPGIFDQVVQATKAFKDYEAQFRLPEIPATVKLIEQLKVSEAFAGVPRCVEQALSMQQAMEAMRKPWLDAVDTLRSVGSFAETQGIGQTKNLAALR